MKKESLTWKTMVLVCAGILLAGSSAYAEEIVLFDGKSMDGWAHTGPGYFGLDERESCLIARGGMGMLFYYDQKFKDFEVVLEFSVNQDNANSGVFVRFPNLPKRNRPPDAQGRNLAGPWGAVNEGYEFQIQGKATGSVYSFKDSEDVPLNEVGAWNEMRIKVVGQHYEGFVNGKKVVEFEGDRAPEGYIGLQNHDPSSIVRFRNIHIAPLGK